MAQFSPKDKTRIYSDAITEALAIAGEELGAPDINAAIAALTHVQGYIISRISDRRTRRLAEKAAVEGLGVTVSSFVNQRIIDAQGKPEGGEH